jgi:hypothetical protein
MTTELVSKRTRNAFREALAGWTLHQIRMEFEAAGIDRDGAFQPDAPGERRTLVEQYYRTLDFTKAADVRRLLPVYESVIERAEASAANSMSREQAEEGVHGLKSTLAKDGLAYEGRRIVATSPPTRALFEEPRSISEVTRRAIIHDIKSGAGTWHGALSEIEFLDRLYNLDRMPSRDGRVTNLRSEIWQHCVNNSDWEYDWVFSDDRIDLLHADDSTFLRFLAEMLHPVVRPDSDVVRTLAAQFNGHLTIDGWELVVAGRISGRPTFVGKRRASGAVVLPDPVHAKDILSDEYVRELSEKCEFRLTSGDLEGAVTVGRTLLEAVLSELETRLTGSKGDHKGDLGKQFKQVARLLRMDDQRPDLDDRFKDVIRGLVMVANGLAALRNKIGEAHPPERRPAPHHARVVVNAAKTVSAFLVESYLVQTQRGLLPSSPKAGGAPP